MRPTPPRQEQLTISPCPYCGEFISRIVGVGGPRRTTCWSTACLRAHNRKRLRAGLPDVRRYICWGCGKRCAEMRAEGRPRILCGARRCELLRRAYRQGERRRGHVDCACQWCRFKRSDQEQGVR